MERKKIWFQLQLNNKTCDIYSDDAYKESTYLYVQHNNL